MADAELNARIVGELRGIAHQTGGDVETAVEHLNSTYDPWTAWEAITKK